MSRYENNGVYEVEIVDHAFNETTGGHPQIEFECKVCRKIIGYGTGNESFAPAESSQYTVTVRLFFASEKQRAFNVRRLRYAGWQGKSFDDFDMIGQKIIVVNRHQSGEGKNAGKVYDNFEFISPPSEARELENKPAIKKKLNALLSKELRESDSVSSPAAQQITREAPKPDTKDEPASYGDDETPF